MMPVADAGSWSRRFYEHPCSTHLRKSGAALFAAGSVFYYQPSWIRTDYSDMIFDTNHSKARAAVSRLLFNPASAEFSTLRSVEMDAAKYVCGAVKAKDKSGLYADYRAFVYTVAIDFARIDDDGQIAQEHDAFRTCPIPEEEKPAVQTIPISPGALSMVKAIQKIIPAADSSGLQALASRTSPGGGKSSGATLERQVGELAARSGAASQIGSVSQPGSGGQQSASSTFKAALGNES